MIPKAVIEEIRGAVDIVEVIGACVSLTKRGANFLGLCPFHQEKTPSFTVNQDKGFFYCFGCKEHGNVFQFLMKYHRYSFYESCVLLAKPLGITIQKETRYSDENAVSLEIYQRAAAYYRESFLSDRKSLAAGYCAQRHVPPEILERFSVGYAPERQTLHTLLSREGYSNEAQLRSGMIVQKGQAFFDYFQRRIMFPICDEMGRVLGFGGRVVDGGVPKYLNSPETYFFQKRSMLYGVHLAKTSIVEQGEVLVVEGYFDVIMAHHMGIQNCVAPLGTSMTPYHIQKLRRYAKTVSLLFDGDDAGRRAMFRVLPDLLNSDVFVKIVALEEGCDPYDFLCKYGAERLHECVRQAPDALEYYLQTHVRNYPNKRNALTQCFPFIKRLDTTLLHEESFSILAHYLGFSKEAIQKEYERFVQASGSPQAPVAKTATKPQKSHSPEKYLFFVLLNHEQLIEDVNVDLLLHYLRSPFYKDLFQKLLSLYKSTGKISITALLELVDTKVCPAILREFSNPQYQEGSSRIVLDCIRRIKLRYIQDQKHTPVSSARKARGNCEEESKVLEEMQFLANEVQKLSPRR